jgi:pimeloyl-ACP methyl ester carboxylesterase
MAEELSLRVSNELGIGADIICTFIPPSTSSSVSSNKILVVFLNGIDNPASLWFPTINALQRQRKDVPALLCYDRPGQEKSPRFEPKKVVQGRPRGHARDCVDAANDLYALIKQIAELRFNANPEDLKIVLVAASVGVAIARLYAQTHPIAALLAVDSTIANSDTISLYPDPDNPDFDERKLPEGATGEMCRDTRKKIWIFHPEAPNREGLWRGNLPAQLPHSDRPQLVGGPWVTVLEHDREKSPKDTEKVLGIKAVMPRVYFDPVWHVYNEGLVKIGGWGRARGRLR